MNVYKKGGTHNCITVRHVDINKELFAPDDPQAISPILKQYLRENSNKNSKICVPSDTRER